MPTPTSSLATLRPDLGGSFEEFSLAADRAGFIGLKLFPVFETMKQAGPFGKITIESLLRNAETDRAPGSGYRRGTWTFTTDTYACEEHGWEEPIDDRESAMYREYFDAEMVSAERARDVVLRNQEKRIAAIVEAMAHNDVTNEWDDATNATPIADVKAGKIRMFEATGMWPNTLSMSMTVFLNLRECDEIIDRIKYSGIDDPKSKGINTRMLAAVFDLDQVLIAGSAKNTADEGQSASLEHIWSNEYALLTRTARSRDIREPCFGRTFHWSEDGSSIGTTIETYRDETVRGDVVRVRHDVHEKTLYTGCADLIGNVTTI